MKRVTEYQENTRARIIEPMTLQGIIDYLAELEDKIEAGTLVEVPRGAVVHAPEERAVRAFVEKLRDKEFSVKIGSEWVAVVKSRDIDELVKEERGE